MQSRRFYRLANARRQRGAGISLDADTGAGPATIGVRRSMPADAFALAASFVHSPEPI
jgi:hypothetical protein